jgi:orotidine-5'-phosphate decarboxylase
MDDRLIVALDIAEASEAEGLARSLLGVVSHLKVGMTLFYAEGPAIVGRLRGMGFDVFLDLKLHDVPFQAGGAATELAKLGASMFTVHASGGRAMVESAVECSAISATKLGVPRPRVLAVTVLTSLDAAALREIGVAATPAEEVAALAALALEVGADGVVCSPQEAAAVRALLGPKALVVTPGVRPSWAAPRDHARVAGPAYALAAGASHIVVGRPITEADDPADAARRVLAEMASD